MKEGCKVKIKRYEDMVENYPKDENGDLDFGVTVFIDEMKPWCEKTVTVTNTYANGVFFILEDGQDYEWCEEMVEGYQPKQAKEMIDHPSHYNQGIEAIDYIESHKMNFNVGNVIKYVTRAKHKGAELEDLKKAQWYLDREIKRLSKNGY